MSIDWNPYQRKIFDWVENGEGNARVKSAAGSGKTTTLIEVANRINGSGLFVAFNKNIQQELSRKLKGTDFIAKTVHSCGYSALSYAGYDLTVNGDKLKRIVNDVVEDKSFDQHKNAVKGDLRNLSDLVRLNLVNPDNLSGIREVARHHGIMNEEIYDLVSNVVQRSAHVAKKTGEIDFTEMIFLPVYWNLSMYKNDWVLVDEAQDLNTCQRELCSRMVKNNGRMIFVGDPNQAIYGFSGADADSFSQIREEFDTTDLPLNITYRCPKSHVERVQSHVPEIEAAPDADEGEIIRDELSKLPDIVQDGDYILCRTNAPLIKEAIRLVKNRIKSHVVGRNIKNRLLQIVDVVGFHNGFLKDLEEYYNDQVQKIEDNDGSEAQIERIRDQIDCLKEVYKSFDINSKSGLKGKIRDLFSGDDDAVKLMTAHKAKGLGNDRIIIIKPELMPLSWTDQKKWELEQEYNLWYVAGTRSKETLILLGDDF